LDDCARAAKGDCCVVPNPLAPDRATTKFEQAINLKTAKALGIMISPNFLVQAGEKDLS